MTSYEGGKLPPPTENDLLISLRSAVGETEAELIWAEACLRAHVLPGEHMNSAELFEAARQLVSYGGLVAVYARSTIIRAQCHLVLAGRQS